MRRYLVSAEWSLHPPEQWKLDSAEEPLREWVLRLDGTELYEGESFLLKVRTRALRTEACCVASSTPRC